MTEKEVLLGFWDWFGKRYSAVTEDKATHEKIVNEFLVDKYDPKNKVSIS